MRVTQRLMNDRLVRDIGSNLRQTYAFQTQVATGKQFERTTDDPVNALEVVRTMRDLRGIEQYRRNINGVRGRLETEDAVLGTMLDLIDEAVQIGITQGSANANPDTRRASAETVRGFINQWIQLGNTRVGEEYLFGGFDVTNEPFDATGAFNADLDAAQNAATLQGTRQVELMPNYVMATNHTGQEIFVDTGIRAAFLRLRDGLDNNDLAEIGASASDLQASFNNLQSLRAELSGRLLQLDKGVETLQAQEITYGDRQAAAWDVDLEEAVVRLAESQTTMQAALLAAGKILNVSLVDYLR